LSLVEAFLPTAISKTEEWIKQMRDRHLETVRTLRPGERSAWRAPGDPGLLDCVRIKEAAEIRRPPFYDALHSQPAFVCMRFDFNFAAAGSLTVDNCVLVRRPPPSRGLLFHGLIHVEPYRQLGVSRPMRNSGSTAKSARGLPQNDTARLSKTRIHNVER